MSRRRPRQDFELPAGAPRGRCRLCQAQIAWITTGEREDGSPKRMPLDLRTVQRGLDEIPRAESHFARCPHAATARRGALTPSKP